MKTKEQPVKASTKNSNKVKTPTTGKITEAEMTPTKSRTKAKAPKVNHKAALEIAFSNILLGEKIPLDIYDNMTGELICPANRRITKTIIRKMVVRFREIELDPSLVRNKVREIVAQFEHLIDAEEKKTESEPGSFAGMTDSPQEESAMLSEEEKDAQIIKLDRTAPVNVTNAKRIRRQANKATFILRHGEEAWAKKQREKRHRYFANRHNRDRKPRLRAMPRKRRTPLGCLV